MVTFWPMCSSTFEASSIFSTLSFVTKTGAAPPFTHFTAQSLCDALAPLAPHFESETQPVSSSATADTANSESKRTTAVISFCKAHLLIDDGVSIAHPASQGNGSVRRMCVSSRLHAPQWLV